MTVRFDPAISHLSYFAAIARAQANRSNSKGTCIATS